MWFKNIPYQDGLSHLKYLKVRHFFPAVRFDYSVLPFGDLTVLWADPGAELDGGGQVTVKGLSPPREAWQVSLSGEHSC